MFFVTFFEKKVTPKNFTAGKVFAHIVRSNTVPRVILSGTKWSRTPKGCAKHRIYEGAHKSVKIKSLPLEGKVPNEMRRMRCRMRSIRDLNINVIKK